MIFGDKTLFDLADIEFTVVDIAMIVGMIPMYYEMIRMDIRLFKRLRETDEK